MVEPWIEGLWGQLAMACSGNSDSGIINKQPTSTSPRPDDEIIRFQSRSSNLLDMEKEKRVTKRDGDKAGDRVGDGVNVVVDTEALVTKLNHLRVGERGDDADGSGGLSSLPVIEQGVKVPACPESYLKVTLSDKVRE